MTDAPVIVRVKPLEWKEWDAGKRKVFDAETAFGYYRITQLYYPEAYFRVETPNRQPLRESTIEAAKAAAQAEYESRILAALDLTPDPRVTALVEESARLRDALTSVLSWHDKDKHASGKMTFERSAAFAKARATLAAFKEPPA